MNSWRDIGRFFFGNPLRAGLTVLVIILLFVFGVVQAIVNALLTLIISIAVGVLVIIVLWSIIRSATGGGGRR